MLNEMNKNAIDHKGIKTENPITQSYLISGILYPQIHMIKDQEIVTGDLTAWPLSGWTPCIIKN